MQLIDIDFAEIIGEENVLYARRKDGSSNQIESDGGIIFWDNVNFLFKSAP